MRAVLIAAVLILSCGPSRAAPGPSATSVPRPTVVADDVRLIGALYAAHNAAWESGPEAGCDAVIASAYPPMRAASDYRLTRAECLSATFHGGPPSAEYREIETPDLTSLERADGWSIPVGSLKGSQVDGRLYVLTLRTLAGPVTQPQQFVDTVHVVIRGGIAYDFTTYAP